MFSPFPCSWAWCNLANRVGLSLDAIADDRTRKGWIVEMDVPTDQQRVESGGGRQKETTMISTLFRLCRLLCKHQWGGVAWQPD